MSAPGGLQLGMPQMSAPQPAPAPTVKHISGGGGAYEGPAGRLSSHSPPGYPSYGSGAVAPGPVTDGGAPVNHHRLSTSSLNGGGGGGGVGPGSAHSGGGGGGGGGNNQGGSNAAGGGMPPLNPANVSPDLLPFLKEIWNKG